MSLMRFWLFAAVGLFLLTFPSITAGQSNFNGTNYHNGVYVTSSLTMGSDGKLTAKCQTDAVDPSTNSNTVPTWQDYHYFSTACTVTPDPDGTILAIQQQNVTCNSPNSPLDQKLLFQSGNGFRRSVTRDFHIYYIFTIS